MSSSRRFLLLLVLACIICVVLVQITMDGKNTGTGFIPSYREAAPLIKHINQVNHKFSNLTENLSHSIKSTSSLTPTKTLTPQKTTPKEKLPNISRNLNFTSSKTNTTLSFKKPLSVKGKGEIKSLSFGRSLAQQPKQIFVGRQERLQELMNKGNVARRRPTLDPMRSLKSIPLTDPTKVTKVFIITYFRAGSSFFGDILQQNWKTFYHFEPLHSMTYDKRIDDEKTPEVFSLFNSIFNCNFTQQKAYMSWVRQPRNQFLFAHNLFLWVTCHNNPRTCFDPNFVDEVCRRAPVHVMKLTRLHMRHLRNYLASNQDMKAKVVYLTRDPRGIVSSRWSLDWCNGTNCSDAGVLCREMDEDIDIFNTLQKQQPSNFIKVRYEDLSLNPDAETEKLFKFLGLPFSPSVKRFLKTHTVGRKNDDKNPYSTRRNSSSMAFSWRERFTYKQITEVQSQCSEVLQKLNHSSVTSPKELPFPNGKPKVKTVTLVKKSPNLRKGMAELIEFKRQQSIKNGHT